MKDLLLSLITGSESSVRRAVRKLFGIGETSGADLATGLFMTLREEAEKRMENAAGAELWGDAQGFCRQVVLSVSREGFPVEVESLFS